ncbi:hypothetical protein [Spongiimicrobium sp. 3-5]|uniref:hypothetical protein n=1 Tax=Spongiimicrobium sp. 3-5 TaxID=3332596 RepID=UPI00398102B7
MQSISTTTFLIATAHIGFTRTGMEVVTPSYVFEHNVVRKKIINRDYTQRSLDVGQFISTYNYLPSVTGIDELQIIATGYTTNRTDFSMETLERVEENYLYTIAKERNNEDLHSENNELKTRMANIEALLNTVLKE